MIVNVKGQTWDVESVDGDTVTLVGGQTIKVSDKTLAEIQAQMKPKPTRRTILKR